MKKFFLLTCLLALSASAAFAQAQIGIRAGLNVSTINDGEDTPDGVDEPWLTGFVIGLTTSFNLNEMVAIAPEINYVQRGSKMEFSELGIDVVQKTRLNYLEVPILLRASFGDVLKGYVNAGPSLAYWLGGKQIIEIDGKEDDEKIDFDDSEDEKRFELGGAIGGGVKLDTEAGSFLIDLRYTAGFSDIFDLDENDEFDKYKNQSVSTSLIYLIGSAR